MNLNIGAIPGECYGNALQLLIANSEKELTVVHGIVVQANTDNNRIVHAWVEDDIYCYDLDGSDMKTKSCPKELYYRIGKIKISETRRYDKGKVVDNATLTGHAGPWDKMLFNHAENEVGSVYVHQEKT